MNELRKEAIIYKKNPCGHQGHLGGTCPF